MAAASLLAMAARRRGGGAETAAEGFAGDSTCWGFSWPILHAQADATRNITEPKMAPSGKGTRTAALAARSSLATAFRRPWHDKREKKGAIMPRSSPRRWCARRWRSRRDGATVIGGGDGGAARTGGNSAFRLIGASAMKTDASMQ
jgi:hypothetical protein